MTADGPDQFLAAGSDPTMDQVRPAAGNPDQARGMRVINVASGRQHNRTGM